LCPAVGLRLTPCPGGIDAPAVTAHGKELTDDEILESIPDVLHTDDRVAIEELEMSSEDGVVYLEGVLPSDVQRQILLEIVSDDLEYEEIVDNILIDRQPWEREDRRPDRLLRSPSAEELAGEEEEAGVDAQSSLETGEPMSPSDELVPEYPKR
jgi:hypothetical protein